MRMFKSTMNTWAGYTAVMVLLLSIGMCFKLSAQTRAEPIDWFPLQVSRPVIVLSNLNAFTAKHTGNIATDKDYYSGALYNFLLVYVGPGNAISGSVKCIATHIDPNPYRIQIWTTNSNSPIPTPPFDQIGENPLEFIEAAKFDIGGGFVVVPVKKRYINKAEDTDLYITLYYTNMPWCATEVCGAMTLERRVKLSEHPRTPFDAWDRTAVNP